jgi:hypothetical protein
MWFVNKLIKGGLLTLRSFQGAGAQSKNRAQDQNDKRHWQSLRKAWRMEFDVRFAVKAKSIIPIAGGTQTMVVKGTNEACGHAWVNGTSNRTKTAARSSSTNAMSSIAAATLPIEYKNSSESPS